jgi:type I restriction enzyme S subunit
MAASVRATGGRDQITQVASSTSGLYTLSISKVAALPIPVCSIEESLLISEEIDRCFSNIAIAEKVIEQEVTRSNALRQSILKRAFSGKLVPQDPSDEPASKLLERLKVQRSTEIPRGRKPRQTNIF